MDPVGLREEKAGHLHSYKVIITLATFPLDLSLAGSGMKFTSMGAQTHEDLCLNTRMLIDELVLSNKPPRKPDVHSLLMREL